MVHAKTNFLDFCKSGIVRKRAITLKIYHDHRNHETAHEQKWRPVSEDRKSLCDRKKNKNWRSRFLILLPGTPFERFHIILTKCLCGYLFHGCTVYSPWKNPIVSEILAYFFRDVIHTEIQKVRDSLKLSYTFACERQNVCSLIVYL